MTKFPKTLPLKLLAGAAAVIAAGIITIFTTLFSAYSAAGSSCFTTCSGHSFDVAVYELWVHIGISLIVLGVVLLTAGTVLSFVHSYHHKK